MKIVVYKKNCTSKLYIKRDIYKKSCIWKELYMKKTIKKLYNGKII